MKFFKKLFGSRTPSERPESQRQRKCGVCGGELHIRDNIEDMTHDGLYQCAGCDLLVRNSVAVARDIKFDKKGGASDSCCGNCRWSTLWSDDAIDLSDHANDRRTRNVVLQIFR